MDRKKVSFENLNDLLINFSDDGYIRPVFRKNTDIPKDIIGLCNE